MNNIDNEKRVDVEERNKTLTLDERRAGINPTKEMVVMALFVAISLVVGQLLTFIKTPYMKVSLGFITIALKGMYLGALRAGLLGMVGDLLEVAMGLIVGKFSPLFTISAMTSGFLAGYFLEGDKAGKIKNVVIWAILSTLIVDTLMNTTWMVFTMHGGDFSKFLVRLAPRALNQVIVTVAKILVVPIIYQSIFKRFRIARVEHNGIRENLKVSAV